MLLSLVALVLVGCGDAPDATGSDEPGASSAPPVSATPTAVETDPGDPGPTELPPSDEPTEGPTDAPESDEPSSTAGTGPAAACTGNDENRDFYAAIADAVSWPVYCPTLPEGWFVTAGQYSLADGGQMEIRYRGPDDASIELRQGSVCADGACAASGDDLGEATFGDRSGTLWGESESGTELFSILVDPDGPPSWVFGATGLSESDVRAIAADLVVVGG